MTMLPQPLRDIFDDILEVELDTLPPEAMAVVESASVIVEDEPGPDVLASMGMSDEEGRDHDDDAGREIREGLNKGRQPKVLEHKVVETVGGGFVDRRSQASTENENKFQDFTSVCVL